MRVRPTLRLLSSGGNIERIMNSASGKFVEGAWACRWLALFVSDRQDADFERYGVCMASWSYYRFWVFVHGQVLKSLIRFQRSRPCPRWWKGLALKDKVEF